MPVSVTIRPHEHADATAMRAAVLESVAEVAPFLPWCHAGYSQADAHAWIELTQQGHRDGTMYGFAIIDEQGDYAGACGINRINAVDRVANIGYWVRTGCTGRGVATAAVRQLVAWAFANTSLNRLEIVVAVDNAKSQRLAEKLGAERDALLKKRIMLGGKAVSAVLYSIVRPDE